MMAGQSARQFLELLRLVCVVAGAGADDKAGYGCRAAAHYMSPFQSLGRGIDGAATGLESQDDLSSCPPFYDMDINRDGIAMQTELQPDVERERGA